MEVKFREMSPDGRASRCSRSRQLSSHPGAQEQRSGGILEDQEWMVRGSDARMLWQHGEGI